jgi:hypothetical protein
MACTPFPCPPSKVRPFVLAATMSAKPVLMAVLVAGTMLAVSALAKEKRTNMVDGLTQLRFEIPVVINFDGGLELCRQGSAGRVRVLLRDSGAACEGVCDPVVSPWVSFGPDWAIQPPVLKWFLAAPAPRAVLPAASCRWA